MVTTTTSISFGGHIKLEFLMTPLETLLVQEMRQANQARRLEQAAPQTSKLSKFLNSPFGLFLLSTVFISVFTWLFNTWTAHEKQTAEETKQRHKIALELMNRVRYINDMQQPVLQVDYHAIESALDGFIPSANSNPSWISHYGAVFPEFQARSLISLVWELETYTAEPQRTQLAQAQKAIVLVRGYIRKFQYYVVQGPSRTPDGKTEWLKLSSNDLEAFKREVVAPIAILADPAFYERGSR